MPIIVGNGYLFKNSNKSVAISFSQIILPRYVTHVLCVIAADSAKMALRNIPYTAEPEPDMEAYRAPWLYKLCFISSISGWLSVTDCSKSFFRVSRHSSTGDIISDSIFGADSQGFTLEYASAVDMCISGLITTMCHALISGTFIGDNVVPVPVASVGVLLMKNGQSAPNDAAVSASWESVYPSSKILLRALSVKAASEEPPPSPAPSGIIFLR